MKRFQISAMALVLMVSAAASSASGAAGSPSSPRSTDPAAGVVSRSGRPVDSGARPVTGTTSTVAIPRTRVTSVRPVNASHRLASGFRVTRTYVTIHGGPPGGCSAGSDVAAAAYRCFTTNNFVIDPCWAEGSPARSVLCLGSPWSTTVTRLRLSGHLSPLPRTRQAVEPWGLHLSNGWKCLEVQGTHDQFKGRVVFYSCGGWASGRVVLLGLDHSRPLWRAQTATRSARGVYRMGPSVGVVTAWYAKP